MNKNEMPEPEKEFLKWLESATERELWSGNYNRATRDEYIAHRVWLHFSKRLEIATEALEEIANGHLQEQVSVMIANKVLEELK